MSNLTLTVAGVRYSGWESIRIRDGIEQLAGSFELSVSERFTGLANPRPLRPGQKAIVAIDGAAIISGYIDVVSPDYDAKSHTLNVSGRDATGDLVDCAAIHKSGAWADRNLAQIARDLCQPFGLSVIVDTDVVKPFKHFAIEPGETVLETLDRAARYRGVLLTSLTDDQGETFLNLTQPGQSGAAPASLELGKNIRRASGHSSLLERFADYIVKAQQAGTDQLYGTAAAAPSGSALDAAIGRYRPTVILAEDQCDAKHCQTRAEWQRTVAAARARQVVYTVGGWQANGALWRKNMTVKIKDQYAGIDETRLISEVAFTLDEQGQRTELTCVPKDAYKPQQVPQPESVGGLW